MLDEKVALILLNLSVFVFVYCYNVTVIVNCTISNANIGYEHEIIETIIQKYSVFNVYKAINTDQAVQYK